MDFPLRLLLNKPTLQRTQYEDSSTVYTSGLLRTLLPRQRLAGEIDESKFGKRKYNRGRMVEGTWVLGGIQRETNHCFLTPCPANRRNESTLLPIIQQFVLPGTSIITDGWKAYINLGLSEIQFQRMLPSFSLSGIW